MAVPKRKTTPSKRNMRRAGNGSYSVNLPNVLTDPTTGEPKLAHHISSDGYYNGKKVINKKEKTKEEPEA